MSGGWGALAVLQEIWGACLSQKPDNQRKSKKQKRVWGGGSSRRKTLRPYSNAGFGTGCGSVCDTPCRQSRKHVASAEGGGGGLGDSEA